MHNPKRKWYKQLVPELSSNSQQMHYAKHKREKIGRCNLCGRNRKLTWDHVPPRGSTDVTRVEMRSILDVMCAKGKSTPPIESQNGLKFRTICGDCNSLLGREFDPTLNEFSRSVGRYLVTSLAVPSLVMHVTKPKRLLKAVLGHLVAAKVEAQPSRFDELAADFVLSEGAQLADEVNIFYWVYPYENYLPLRDFLLYPIGQHSGKPVFCQLLKFFPIAFLVCDLNEYTGLPSLSRYASLGLDDEVRLPIELDRLEEPHWPERPTAKNILFGGEGLVGSISARPRNRG